jgi:hypothetical protein
MKIETLRNKYEFIKDDKCIALYKVIKVADVESKNYGEDTHKLIGYYSGIEGVLKKLHFLELIERGTVNDLLKDIERVTSLVLSVRESLEAVE